MGFESAQYASPAMRAGRSRLCSLLLASSAASGAPSDNASCRARSRRPGRADPRFGAGLSGHCAIAHPDGRRQVPRGDPRCLQQRSRAHGARATVRPGRDRRPRHHHLGPHGLQICRPPARRAGTLDCHALARRPDRAGGCQCRTGSARSDHAGGHRGARSGPGSASRAASGRGGAVRHTGRAACGLQCPRRDRQGNPLRHGRARSPARPRSSAAR